MFVLTNILGHGIQDNINKKLFESVYLRHVNFKNHKPVQPVHETV